jgi:peptidoglycan-associated lipoprotein
MKPTVTLSADRTSVNKGESARLSWTSTDAQNLSIAPEDFLKGYPQMHVTIEGHCDERGSTEYNLALGDRRANAVKQYLISLGIPDERFNAVSFGKEKPFCTEAKEACYTRNRRGHFVQVR